MPQMLSRNSSRRVQSRLLNSALLIAIAVCLVGLVLDRRRLSSARLELARLEALVGILRIDDLSRLHLRLIEDNGPEELVWRVYLPGNGASWRFSFRGPTGRGGNSKFTTNQPREILVRVRMTLDAEEPMFYMMFNGSWLQLMSPSMAKFIVANWRDLDIQIAGRSGQSESRSDQVRDLLTVTVPESLLDKVKEDLGVNAYQQFKNEPLVHIELGQTAAVVARRAAQSKAMAENQNGE